MALSRSLVMLLFCLILCTQARKQRSPREKRSKLDITEIMSSYIKKVDERLSAIEVSSDNSTEERLAQLEAKMEGELQEKLQDMEEKLQGLQGGMQRLESMMNVMAEKMAEIMEAKANATEQSAASIEATTTEPQSTSATCQYQCQHQFERESSRSSGEQQGMAKVESRLTRLQEKVSALYNHLLDNDVSIKSLQNASTMAVEGVVHSMTELMTASEQSLKSTMENATKLFYDSTGSMMNASFFALTMSDLEAHLLARVENSTALLDASIAIVEQTVKELATNVSAVGDKLDNARSLHAKETDNTRAMLADMKNTTKEMCGPPQNRKTCQDYYNSGQRTSGIYSLDLQDGQVPIEVYCNMHSGTGWVVFQRRKDGSIGFYRDWSSYKEGFGDLLGEFWLGNRNIHRLTRAGLTHLRVDLQAWNGSTAFASYNHFSVGDATSSYRLSVYGYWGTAGDSLGRHSGYKFSAFDQDNDVMPENCAQIYKGAWWYHNNCYNSNLNGQYGARDSSGWEYVVWQYWLDKLSLQRTELKLK